MKRIFMMSLLFGAMILGFSACEKEKKTTTSLSDDDTGGGLKAILITNDLQGATATLSKKSGIAFDDVVTLTVKLHENYRWESSLSATATHAILKDKNRSSEGDYRFYFTGFDDNSIIIVSGVAVPTTGGDSEDSDNDDITDQSDTENGHAYVDLGLSVMWATCNVGATKPEEYGDYFAWGETEPKSTYKWNNYKYGSATSSSIVTKYCTKSNNGTVDNKTTLDLADDAAHANWGGAWRMPTRAEQKELLDNCTWIWTMRIGVNGYGISGYEVIGKNGKSVFLPTAGGCGHSDFIVGSGGYYWSASLSSLNSSSADRFAFDSGNRGWNGSGRYFGLSVRAVCSK